MPLVGYSDRLSVRAGETIEFKMSATGPAASSGVDTELWLTHSICADPNPAGPGMIERNADRWFSPASVTVCEQDFQPGSYGVTDVFGLPVGTVSLQLQANFWPTLLEDSRQCIVSYGALSLCAGADHRLSMQAGDHVIQLQHRLAEHHWYRAIVDLQRPVESNDDSESGEALIRATVSLHAVNGDRLSLLEELVVHLPQAAVSALFGGMHAIGVATGFRHEEVTTPVKARKPLTDTCFFNGKIEAPSLSFGDASGDKRGAVSWDFSADMGSTRVPAILTHSALTHAAENRLVTTEDTVSGTGGGLLALQLHNLPARAMTGSRWQAQEMCWRQAPELYAAIHFHDDDIVDFDWKTTFSYTIPHGMPSGVYVMHARNGSHEDAMPFYVCPPLHARSNRVCVLIPTFTYAIYGNHARPDWQPSWKDKMRDWGAYPYNPAEYRDYGLSTYNNHHDGSGICHASHLRPLFNLRPGYITFGNTTCSGLRHFQADSHLLAWLDHNDIGFDVITDRELHDEGLASIAGYELLLTTTHPEYHTSRTLDALTEYRDSGGHLCYLGGNGFYWRIAVHQEHPDALEIRRAEDGIRAWAAEPGEYYHAFDGQYGGLWRRNGRPPQALCGLGFSAQGQFNGSYYRRRPVSDDLLWLFDGIDEDIIGDFGLCGGGAAGFELDRVDSHLGTPDNATVLASSENHGEDFILVPEEMLTHLTTLPGPPARDLLRADIIWFEVPGGGSVFSVGSITFCGSLPHNGYENPVSQLLRNVVDHVLEQERTQH